MLKLVAFAALVCLAMVGCGGSDDDGEAPTATLAAAGSATTAQTVTATGTSGANPTQAATTAPTATPVPPTAAPTQPAPTATQTAPQPKTVTVQLGDQSFNPSNSTIRAGDTVDWRWAGDIPHSVTSRGGFASDPAGIKTSGSYSFTFTTPGTYEYFCQVHEASGMKGTVIVQ